LHQALVCCKEPTQRSSIFLFYFSFWKCIDSRLFSHMGSNSVWEWNFIWEWKTSSASVYFSARFVRGVELFPPLGMWLTPTWAL
jgi:hypothetical protein